MKTPTFKEFKAKKDAQFKKERRAGKLKAIIDIGRSGTNYFLRDDWVIFEQSDMHGRKAFVLERFILKKREGKRFHQGGTKLNGAEIRIGYFIVTRRKFWGWGESCPFVPKKDLPKLLNALRRLSRNS